MKSTLRANSRRRTGSAPREAAEPPAGRAGKKYPGIIGCGIKPGGFGAAETAFFALQNAAPVDLEAKQVTSRLPTGRAGERDPGDVGDLRGVHLQKSQIPSRHASSRADQNRPDSLEAQRADRLTAPPAGNADAATKFRAGFA